MIPNQQIRQFLFLVLIFAFVGLIFWNLCEFVPAIMGAYTLFVILRKPVRYLSERRNWNKYLAAGLMMLASFFVILAPVYALISMLSAELIRGFKNSKEIGQSVDAIILNVETRVNLDLITPERIQLASEWSVQQLSGILNDSLFGLIQVAIAYFILWFMLTEGRKMQAFMFNWLPMKDENIVFVRQELNNLVLSNAIGIPMMGVVQGLTGLLGYWLAGADNLLFWVFMTFIAGMIPLFGVMLAFLPLSMILFSKGMNAQAIFLLIYGFAVIGSVDNLARMWLMKKIGHTHPLVTLFGVIIGLKLFGFVGFIFGPILIAMFLLMEKIYLKEFSNGENA